MLAVFILAPIQLLFAGNMPHDLQKLSTELERIQALAGKWKGTSVTDGENEKAKVEYRVTSGGSAVVETLFQGTPHEMISVYHDKKGKLTLTHYCMLGNQPELRLRKSDAHSMRFELAKGSGIDVRRDQHMHSLNLDFKDRDHIVQTWGCFEKGKENMQTVIALARR